MGNGQNALYDFNMENIVSKYLAVSLRGVLKK